MGDEARSPRHRYSKCDEEYETVEEKNCKGLTPQFSNPLSSAFKNPHLETANFFVGDTGISDKVKDKDLTPPLLANYKFLQYLLYLELLSSGFFELK